MTAIQSIRIAERNALAGDGKITKTEAKGLLALATTKEAKAALRDILAHDSFAPGAAKTLTKAAGKLDEKTSSLAGMKLGTVKTNGANLDVVVSKELSPTAGFADEFQAYGAARASGVTPTTVIKDGNTPPRWHAVQTNITVGGKGYAPEKTKLGEVTAMPRAPTPDDFKRLHDDASATRKAFQASGTDANRKAAEAASVKLAAATFGIDPAKIHPMKNDTDILPDKINVTLEIAHGAAYFGDATTNVEPLNTDGTVRSPHGLVVNPVDFRSVTHGAGTLAHEATHKEHHDLGNQVAKEFHDSKTSKSFSDWMKTRKPKLTGDQRDMISEQVANKATTQTELSAYINELAATVAAYPAGDKEAVMTYGSIKSRLGALGNDDKKTLKALYDALDEPHRTEFEKYLPKPG